MAKSSVSQGTVLFVAMVGSFVTPFMGSSVNIALPAIQKELAMDAVMLSWVQTAFLLAAAVFMVPVGRLADIYGRKKTFLWGMFCFTASTMVCALCGSAAGLIAARIGQGLGSAMIFASSLAIITSVFPLGERGRAIGFTVASVYVGLSLGPVLGGLLTQNLGWRSIFWLNVPLGLATIFLVLWKLTGEWAEARGERFDLPGALIYGLVLASVMFGLTLLPDFKGLGLIGLGLAGLIVFIKWELKAAAPVLQVKLFRNNATFAFSNLAALIHYSATFAVVFLMSLYLQYIKGLPPQKAGFILVTQPLVMAVFSPLAGRLSDRVEPRLVASAGMGLTGLGLFIFTFLGPESATALIVGNLALIGLGFALFSSPNTNAIMSSVTRNFLGQASGAVSTMRLIGQMVSMGLTALVFALIIGRVRITPEHYPAFLQSVRIAFFIFSGLCVLGVAASLQRGRVLSGPNRSDE